MKMKTLLIYLFLLFTLLNLSCNKTITEPEDIKPGRRDYVWTVDTLHGQGYSFDGMWGSSPEDIWVCGADGGMTPYDFIQHFDGEKWSPYPEIVPVGDAYCIFGFSKDNVWLGGNDGKILRFDGNTWQNVFTYTKEGQYSSLITDIWGDSPSNIYATGSIIFEDGVSNNDNKGFLLHYDGANWKELFLTKFGVQFFKVRNERENVFLVGYNNYTLGGVDSVFFYQYSKFGLGNLFSYRQLFAKSLNEIGGFANLNNIGNEIYFLIGQDLYKYSDNTVGKLDKFLNFPLPQHWTLYNVYGRNEKDIFISTKYGLFHYNGNVEDIQMMFNSSPPLVIRNCAIFENEVFFNVNTSGENYIYHGMLNKMESMAN